MRLFIAEKPSLGRAIADVLAKPLKKQDGCIYSADGDCVTWCIGHLLEQAEPERYDASLKKWSIDRLPIIPEQWQLVPKSKTRKQLKIIKSLIKQADSIVHAGDPDREGQLLVDQVLAYHGVKGARAKGVQRLLISDLNSMAVRHAMTKMRDNNDFIPLSTSALARSRADWLYGINMTRAYTLQGQKVGYQGVLSVGRVQTPVLGLVVERDRQIQRFISKPFYQVEAVVKQQGGQSPSFRARWQPSKACDPYRDEQGRVLNKGLAENVCSRISGQVALVSKLDKTLKKQPPPLLFNLSALQIEANKRYAMTAQQVLDNCQQLYERHQLITYPRSDSRYLPVDQHAMAGQVSGAVAANIVELNCVVDEADLSLKGRCWNDSKVDAHHAIIPTARKQDVSALDKPLRQLYELISRYYLAQFLPSYAFNETTVELEISGGVFVAKARQEVELGYKKVLPDRGHQQEQTLPALAQGEMLSCIDAKVLEKATEPPKPYNDGTLLAAMTGISRYVSSDAIRKILKDTDGLGTEATRAGIIELLFKRSFLQRCGKNIQATEAGKGLIASLPVSATSADMTAQWEAALNSISERESSYSGFMTPLQQSLFPLIKEAKATLPTGLKGVKVAKPKGRRRSTTAKKITRSART
ncbi:DNA topoisomerase 3 [Sinobacterium norvegicum]|uniref:DNA topoisomerase n=1 Tax=Sinobacterium norvegicum TaxID=1641715 RepID=A0ABM9AEZ7_9GAMM|nr:DNA topoisomerase III [Sinobacterium norvegicum]CAH0991605.1 DNA topoisomerase 3 [Sinobacterium norvegicum]